MSYTSQKDRGTKASKSSWLITLLISLVALVAVGCGDSNEDYVFTGTNPGPANTGNVTFQFERLVAAKIGVPTATQTLEFEFYNSQGVAIANANGVANPFYSAPYADTITVPNVPVGAVDYVITARTGGTPSIPLAQYGGDLTVVAGSTVVVTDADVSEPITFGINAGADFTLAVGATKQLVVLGTFSNGETYTATADADFASNNAAANVSATGLVTGVSAGSAVVTATVELLGVEYTDAVNVTVGSTPPPVGQARLEFNPTSVTLNTSTTANVAVTYFAANSTTGVVVTNQTTGVAVGALNATYTAGVVAAGNTTGTGTINVTYTTGNTTVTAPLSVTINAGGVTPPPVSTARIEANFDSLVLDGQVVVNRSGKLKVLYYAAGSTTGVDVTSSAVVTFGSFNPGTVTATDFNYQTATGTGQYTFAVVGSVPTGATAVATVTYGVGGQFLTDTVNLTAGTTAEAAAVVEARFVTVGDTLILPGSSTYPLAAVGVTAAGVSNVLNLAPGNGYTVGNVGGNIAAATYTAGSPATTRLLTASAVGSTTIELRSTATGTPLLDSFEYTGIPAVASYVSTVAPANISFVSDATGAYQVVLTYASGETQDVTPVFLPAYTVATGATVVPTAAVEGAYPGTLTTTGAATGTLSTAVAPGVITGFNIVGATRTDTPANVTVTAAP